MLRRNIVFLAGAILMFSAFSLQSQSYRVYGRVMNEITGEALPFASVYLANTTYGTASNEEGVYEFYVKKPGTYQLSVKYLGFKLYLKEIELNLGTELEVDINLMPAGEEVSGVVVRSKDGRRGKGYYETEESIYVDEKGPMWSAYYDSFESMFIGPSSSAKKTTIENPDVLRFEMFKKDSVFEVSAVEPIIITNRELGYRMEYTLEEFKLDLRTHLMSFQGYPFFKQLQARNKREYNQWRQNRWRVYRGSLRHFLKSLFADKLEEAGFLTSRLAFLGNQVDVNNPKLHQLSVAIDLYDYLAGESGNRRKLRFSNAWLLITAANSVEEDGFKRPEIHERLFGKVFNNGKKNLQKSWIEIQPDKVLEFAANGYIYNPLDFAIYGYWSYKRISEMLPADYEPEEIHKTQVGSRYE